MATLLKIFALTLLWDLIAPSEITQEIVLNRNTSFVCNVSSSERNINWMINERDDYYYIYPLDHSPVDPELRERGFVSKVTSSPNNTSVLYELIIIGTIENNETQISCRNHTVPINTYIMIVIGTPDSPVNVTGLVMTSLQVIRVEWQEPFSHRDHLITYYTVYKPNDTLTNITDTEHLTFNLGDEEFNICRAIIMVTATNDIGESKPSVASILKVPDQQNFVINGSISSQDERSIIELTIQFPKLCVGQHMTYTITLTEGDSEHIIYHNTMTTMYSGDILQYNDTITVLEDGDYTIDVYLETGQWNISSPLLHIMIQESTQETRTGNDTQRNGAARDILLGIIIALLVAVVIITVAGTIIIAGIYTRRKLSSGSHQVVKQNINPIYESPLYENMEEQQQQQQQKSGFTPLPCAERSDRVFSIDNIYHSDPITISSNSGMYSEVGMRKCQPSGRGEANEEDEYTVMRTLASSNAVSSTPYHEDRVDWLINKH